MITLLTGLPGNGKTLFALWFVKQKAEKENREVYYHNIKDLTLPWTVTDPEKWFDLPAGSIIVIDEAQFVFSKKPSGSKLPDFYEKLAVHRHSGYDIFIITQHPSLIDNFVRQLVGQHFHTVRKFGMNRSTVYEWSAANPAPQNPSAHKSAISLKWAYPKEVYTYYKSAEVHTVKRAIPAKIFLALGFVGLVLVGGWWAMHKYKARYEKKPDPSLTSEAGAVNVVETANVRPKNTNNTNTPDEKFDPLADAQQYVAVHTPRVEGLPHTAPVYDPITAPVRAPVPAACVQIGTTSGSKTPRCQCYSQQGTRMDVQYNMCISMAQNGWFRDFEPDKNQQASAAPVASVPPAPAHVERAEVRPPVSGGYGPVVVSMGQESSISEQRSSAPQDPPSREPVRGRKAFTRDPSA
jgi:zona occludens toxin